MVCSIAFWLHNSQQNALKLGNPADYECAIYMCTDCISIAHVCVCTVYGQFHSRTHIEWH